MIATRFNYLEEKRRLKKAKRTNCSRGRNSNNFMTIVIVNFVMSVIQRYVVIMIHRPFRYRDRIIKSSSNAVVKIW